MLLFILVLSLIAYVHCIGRPAANRYIWRRGGHRVNYVDSYNWTISPVTLETEANISCVAVNQVGQGEPDFITIEVFGELNTSFYKSMRS